MSYGALVSRASAGHEKKDLLSKKFARGRHFSLNGEDGWKYCRHLTLAYWLNPAEFEQSPVNGYPSKKSPKSQLRVATRVSPATRYNGRLESAALTTHLHFGSQNHMG